MLSVVAIATDGRERVSARATSSTGRPPSAGTRSRARTQRRSICFRAFRPRPGGASELDVAYAPYLSSSIRAGFRVPILYLRMTKGASADYVFDPDWDPVRKCGERPHRRRLAARRDCAREAEKLPVLVTLNGGIWADAYCDVPQWDVNDKLEQDVRNCQWNEKNEVMPDNFLKDLPGSQEAPELARSLTFNVVRERRAAATRSATCSRPAQSSRCSRASPPTSSSASTSTPTST
jgi:hypothetical protein